LDDANEHHFIGGNIAVAHHPLERLDRNALALLKTVLFLISEIHRHIQDKNAPLNIVARDSPHA